MRTRVALTFDAEHPDRPGAADGCTRVLDALAPAGAPATFFVQGRWALARPAEARRIAADGHLVALHCHSHVAYPRLRQAGVAADLAEGRQAVREACGVDPAPWFRFPYVAGADDPVLCAVVGAAGFTHVDITVNTRDWCACVRPDRLVETVLAAVARGPDPAVPLYHTWPSATARALPATIEGLRAAGAELVTVDRLDPAEIAALRLAPDSRTSGACTCAAPLAA
jgi:peptidoglycan/xylan/chitin deacetylase (PgdA/CDA1 family)